MDVTAITAAGVDPGLPGGSELIALGRAALGRDVDAATTKALAAVVGEPPAVRAAAVAGAFELYNRIVDATGLPVGHAQRAAQSDIIEDLGLARFPHAGHGI